LFLLTFRLYTNAFATTHKYRVNQNQDDTLLVVGEICIAGNKKTKERILLRELPVLVGDSIGHHQLDSILERCKQQLVNLGLFNVVRVTHRQKEANLTEINIYVIERWYTWPLPILQIADRNFNQWWISKDLERINYGVELSQFNFRGRNETLKIKFQNGFT